MEFFFCFPSTPAADTTLQQNLASTQIMSFESANSLHTAIDTAYDKIFHGIRDGTLADAIPCMKQIFVSVSYSYSMLILSKKTIEKNFLDSKGWPVLGE